MEETSGLYRIPWTLSAINRDTRIKYLDKDINWIKLHRECDKNKWQREIQLNGYVVDAMTGRVDVAGQKRGEKLSRVETEIISRSRNVVAIPSTFLLHNFWAETKYEHRFLWGWPFVWGRKVSPIRKLVLFPFTTDPHNHNNRRNGFHDYSSIFPH